MKKFFTVAIATAAICVACTKVETEAIPQDEQKSILENAITRCTQEVNDADFSALFKVAESGYEYCENISEEDEAYNKVMEIIENSFSEMQDEDIDGDGIVEEIEKLTINLSDYTGKITYDERAKQWTYTEADNLQIIFPVDNETFTATITVKDATNSSFNPVSYFFVYIPKQIKMSMTLGSKTLASADIQAVYTQKKANIISVDDAVKFDGTLTVCDITLVAKNIAIDKSGIKSEISLSTTTSEIFKETEEMRLAIKNDEVDDFYGFFNLTFMDAATVSVELVSYKAVEDVFTKDEVSEADIRILNDNLIIGVYYKGNSTKQITITFSMEDGLILTFADGTVYENGSEFISEKVVNDLINAIKEKLDKLEDLYTVANN